MYNIQLLVTFQTPSGLLGKSIFCDIKLFDLRSIHVVPSGNSGSVVPPTSTPTCRYSYCNCFWTVRYDCLLCHAMMYFSKPYRPVFLRARFFLFTFFFHAQSRFHKRVVLICFLRKADEILYSGYRVVDNALILSGKVEIAIVVLWSC